MEHTDKEETLIPGPVIVTRGKHKGRIGYYDDDTYSGSCFVYFGEMALSENYHRVRPSSLSNVIPTVVLMERIAELRRLISSAEDDANRFQLTLELAFCSDLLNTSNNNATNSIPEGSFKIFISLASEDNKFARMLATDLKNAGYECFFYEWSIGLGENILQKVGEGVDAASALIPVISHNFNKSVCCLDEWTSYYNRYAKIRPNSIYTFIIDDADAPTLLAARKYVRIKEPADYTRYLKDLLKALEKHM